MYPTLIPKFVQEAAAGFTNDLVEAFRAELTAALATFPVAVRADPEFEEHLTAHDGFEGPIYVPTFAIESAAVSATRKLKPGFEAYCGGVYRISTIPVHLDRIALQAMSMSVAESIAKMPGCVAAELLAHYERLRANPHNPTPAEMVLGPYEVIVKEDPATWQFTVTSSVLATLLPPGPVTPERKPVEQASEASEGDQAGALGGEERGDSAGVEDEDKAAGGIPAVS